MGTQTNPITTYQGTLVENTFLVMTNQDQRFILDNPQIDSSTITVFVSKNNTSGLGRQFKKIDNILNLSKDSEIFLIQEIQDENFEILFGDGYFGKKLENNSIITVRYIVTDGEEGNGASEFSFQGVFKDRDPDDIGASTVIPDSGISVNTI